MDKQYVLQVAETAKNQLLATTPMNVVLSWGVEKFIATIFREMPALKFRVNGRLFKGFVVVALNGSDYYEIYLMDYQETKCITDRVFLTRWVTSLTKPSKVVLIRLNMNSSVINNDISCWQDNLHQLSFSPCQRLLYSAMD